MLQEAEPPFIPAGAHAMTVVIEYPPGDPGTPPGTPAPAFGYVLEGEMLLELEGEPERVVATHSHEHFDQRQQLPARLEGEVEAELSLAESSRAEEATRLPASEWLAEPADTERYVVGLHSLLGAVEALEGDSRPDHRSVDENT